MATALTIITDALQDIGVLDATQAPETQDVAIGLRRLNQFIGQLATQRLTMFEVRRSVFNLVANTASYTIGPTGTWVTARPLFIDRVAFILDRTAAQPVELPSRKPWTAQEWQAVPVKSTTSNVPENLFYDYANSAAGLGVVTVYPVPSVSLPQAVLYLPQPLARFADETTDYALADGYELMLVKHLALLLSRPYARQVDPGLVEEAKESLALIKSANWRPRLRSTPVDALAIGGGGASRYNIYTDQ